MSWPRLLDLFAGAQGCGVGYARAGFTVTAVDIEAHDKHPEVEEFITADAMDVLADMDFLSRFDAIHASPPCQAYSVTSFLHDAVHPDLVGPVRDALETWGGSYIIENVVGAPLSSPVLMCGAAFSLGATCRDGVWRPLKRHRLFESNQWLMSPGCACSGRESVGVYGHGGSGNNPAARRGYQATAPEAREAMGIDWMKHYDVVQAIPPAYTEYLGRQLIEHLSALQEAS